MGRAQTPADNLQVILQLFDRAACRVAEQISHERAAAIFVQAASPPSPEERFFSSRLVTILNDTLPVPIFTEPVELLKTVALTHQLHRCQVVYRSLSNRRLVYRHASVLIEFEAHDAATRQMLFQKIWEESAADTVAEKSLPRLENVNLPFTVGKWEKRETGLRWLEPVLITSATGIIVYLFYALRSR